MQKTRKQLLGLAGLAAVGIMTVVAYGMPTPDAAAVTGPDYANGYDCDNSQPGNECATKTGDVNVQVTVRSGKPVARVASPRDKSTTLESPVPVTVNYDEVNKIDYQLTYKDEAGVSHTVDLAPYVPATNSGQHTFDIDVAQYGYTDFELRLVAHGNNGATFNDMVSFSYRAISAAFDQGNNVNGDPILNIGLNEEVEKLTVYVYDKAGNPAFVDENGKEIPIMLDRTAIDPKTGHILTALPFGEHDLTTGDYTAVVTAYNDDGDIISMATASTHYVSPSDPEAPETPNTGSLFIEGLNITRLDYLLTGLIVFGMMSAFAVYLVVRKHRR